MEGKHQIKEAAALEYLEAERLLHIDMIEVIKRGFAEVYYAGRDGVAMRETKGATRYLSVTERKKGEELLEFFHPGEPLLLHQEFMLEPVLKRLQMKGFHKCYQLAYLKEERASEEESRRTDSFEIHRLGMEWRDVILHIYQQVEDPGYIELLLKEGVMYGAFLGKELAGFIGMHTEGCMGLLEVLPEFRRRGVGELLERFLIDKNREQGFLPFCQVFADNEPSLRLQRKLGLTAAKQFVWWVY